jgi:hypothetical protein
VNRESNVSIAESKPLRRDRARHVVLLIVLYLFLGASASVAIAWALAFKVAPGERTESASAIRGEEHVSVTVRRGFGTTEAVFNRTFGQDWSPIRAAGPPDTLRMGDIGTAWASLNPDDQIEWLELDYGQPVIAHELRIYETNAPGALMRVSFIGAAGNEIDAWRGADPARSAKRSRECAFISIRRA